MKSVVTRTSKRDNFSAYHQQHVVEHEDHQNQQTDQEKIVCKPIERQDMINR